MHKCICGEEYPTRRELRLHIAIITPRWPAQRCSHEHYDPKDEADLAWIASHKPDDPNRDRRFK